MVPWRRYGLSIEELDWGKGPLVSALTTKDSFRSMNEMQMARLHVDIALASPAASPVDTQIGRYR